MMYACISARASAKIDITMKQNRIVVARMLSLGNDRTFNLSAEKLQFVRGYLI